jgi:hypothetical protein
MFFQCPNNFYMNWPTIFYLLVLDNVTLLNVCWSITHILYLIWPTALNMLCHCPNNLYLLVFWILPLPWMCCDQLISITTLLNGGHMNFYSEEVTKNMFTNCLQPLETVWGTSIMHFLKFFYLLPPLFCPNSTKFLTPDNLNNFFVVASLLQTNVPATP